MNRAQLATLLTLRASFHGNVRVGETDVEAWHAVIGDLDYNDALKALAVHYADSTDWSMPAHIRHAVRRTREARLANTQLPQPPPDMDPDDDVAYRRWLTEVRRRAANGGQPPEITGGAG